MKELITVRPAQLRDLLHVAIRIQEPTLIVGGPGIGKTDIVCGAARDAGADLLISHPVVLDPTDAKGLPWPSPNADTAKFLPFGELAAARRATKSTVWFLDDLGQAPPATQAAFMHLLYGGSINEHRLPECVTFIAATNRRTDRAGVSGLLEPVKSRFGAIMHLEPNLEDWTAWAIDANQPAEVIAFLRFRPNLLYAFQPTADLTNFPCPRTWVKVGRWLKSDLPRSLEVATIAGAIGVGAATEFIAFLKMYRDLPDIDAVLKAPDTAPIPTEPSGLYAVSSALAYRASSRTFANILRYAERLREAGHTEFGVLLIRDSYRRDKKIGFTREFIDMCSTGAFGKIMDAREVNP
jgi:hypothetical protein